MIADALVALQRQPVDRAPRVEHRLPVGLQRAADVRADDVVGALELGRAPDVVIGQAQPQRGDAEPREQLAEPDVAFGVGVPLRQHDDGAPRLIRRAARAPGKTRTTTVLLRIGRRDERAREAQHVAAALVVARVERRRVKKLSLAAVVWRAQAERGALGDRSPIGSRSSQSRPHSNGRTTRLVSTDASRRSQA